MTARMTKLSSDLLNYLEQFSDDLLFRFLTSTPVDKTRAQKAFQHIYDVLGYSRPTFIWCQNPLELAHAPACVKGFSRKRISISRLEEIAGRSCRLQIQEGLGANDFEEFFNQAWSTWPRVAMVQLTNFVEQELFLLRHGRSNGTLSKNFLQKWTEWGIDADSDKVRINDRLFALAQNSRTLFESIPTFHDQVEAASNSLVRLALSEFAQNYLELQFESEMKYMLDCLLELANSNHAYICYEDVCFVCERPTQLHMDENRRFHKEFAPAIEYGGGFVMYAWRGLRLPAYAVCDEPSLQNIHCELNAEVRRVLVERYGLAKYLRDTGSILINQDDCGTLYRKEMTGDEPIVLLQLTNSTPEPDGTYRIFFLRVPPEMRSAREAVAWTFGMNSEEYIPTRES